MPVPAGYWTEQGRFCHESGELLGRHDDLSAVVLHDLVGGGGDANARAVTRPTQTTLNVRLASIPV